MSELSRVTIPYGSQTVSNKVKHVVKKTIRLSVKLPQSNEDTCPEYNYKDELDAVKKRDNEKHTCTENGDSGYLFDDDGDVRRIAQEMEEKYGKSEAVVRKKRRGRRDDYADIGMGYDESDSFIDNTHGYDEIIPQNVTTLLGGFYINCGSLEFKADNEESMDSSSSSIKESTPKHRKRLLESSDDDDEEEDAVEGTPKANAEKKSKLDIVPNGMQKAIKKKLFSHNKIQVKKRRPVNPLKKTVKDLLREKRDDLNMTAAERLLLESDVIVVEEKETVVENSSYVSNLSDIIESVVKAADENPASTVSENKLPIKSSQNATENSINKLPENLPNNITEVMNRIKQASILPADSNQKFTSELNSLLLSLERRCKCLGKPSKMKVFENLALHMNIDKETLIQHGQQLAKKDEEKKIRTLLDKLKKEINLVMPTILSNYEKECLAVLQKKSTLQSQDGNKEEGSKSIRNPKRKFHWNEQTKKLLKDTTSIRKRCYLMEGVTKEALENEMGSFLKNNVLTLWPEGWMTMVSLTKICNNLSNMKNNTDSKTASTSNSKKESKPTAQNSPSFTYPNLSITPVMNSISHSKSSHNKNPVDIKLVQEASKDKVHQPKSEPLKIDKQIFDMFEANNEQKSNNSNMFLKVEYEKLPPTISPTNILQAGSSAKKVSSIAALMSTIDASRENKETTYKYPPVTSVEREINLLKKLVTKPKIKSPTEIVNSNISQSDLIVDSRENKETLYINPSMKDVDRDFCSITKRTTKLKSKSPSDFVNSSMSQTSSDSKVDSAAAQIYPEPRMFLPEINHIVKPVESVVIPQMTTSLSDEHFNPGSFCDGDENIQTVMEHLKNLQKMSSPIKTSDNSSPAILNSIYTTTTKNPQRQKSVLKNIDLVTTSFQDEFQKQLFSGIIGTVTPTTSKSNYKCS